MNELISVIIPTYNRYKFLCKAILSVLNQTYDNIEIIIIDDCSTELEYKSLDKLCDLTSQILNKNRMIKIIQLPINMRKLYNVNAAQGLTRNEGIKIASGKWIAFLDDDDQWLPEKLEIQMKCLKQYYPIIKMCSSNMCINVDKQTKYHSNKLPPIITKYQLLNSNLINTSTVVVEKELLLSVGMFPIGVNEDYKCWIKILQHTMCVYLNELLTNYDTLHGYGIQYNNN